MKAFGGDNLDGVVVEGPKGVSWVSKQDKIHTQDINLGVWRNQPGRQIRYLVACEIDTGEARSAVKQGRGKHSDATGHDGPKDDERRGLTRQVSTHSLESEMNLERESSSRTSVGTLRMELRVLEIPSERTSTMYEHLGEVRGCLARKIREA